MEKQIFKIVTLQGIALVGISLLLPATDWFGLALIKGSEPVSMSSLVGVAVWLSMLAWGGRMILGDRAFVDPLRTNNASVAGDYRYQRYARFPAPFIPGTRGPVQVTSETGITPDLTALGDKLERAFNRKLQKLENKKSDSGDQPVLV